MRSTLLLAALIVSSCAPKDAGPDTDSDSDVDSVPSPSAPIVTLTQPEDHAVVAEGLPVLFQGQVSDDQTDAQQLQIAWSDSADGVLDTTAPDATGAVSFSTAALTRGAHTITLSAADDGGLTTDATITITVDALPTVQTVTLAPDPVREGESLTCGSAGVEDADGDTVTLATRWEVNGVGVSGDQATLDDVAWRRGDVVRCVVTPNDGLLDGPEVTSNDVVVENSAPSLQAASILPAPAHAADTLSCVPSGWLDLDGDPEQVTRAWTVNGVAAGGGTSPSVAPVGGDVVSCALTPTDGLAAGVPVDATITVANTPPVLAAVSLGPGAATVLDTLRCTPGDTWDDDGTSAFTYTYAWTVDGAPVANDGDTLVGQFARGDVVECVATPSDGVDQGAPVTSNALRIVDAPPTVVSVTLQPDPLRADDTAFAGVEASDPDGDEVVLSYAWTVNGVDAAGPDGTLDASWFERGDEVVVVVTPFDGRLEGDSVRSATATVVNSPPTVGALDITPADPTLQSTLHCAASELSDADGDMVDGDYVWTLETGDQDLDVGVGPDLAGVFVHGDQLHCTFTPSDGVEPGEPRTSTVEIVNSAPQLAEPHALVPTTVYPGFTFTALEGSVIACFTGAASDADGDLVTQVIEWEVNGVVVGWHTNALRSEFFSKGDTVQCFSKATDALGAVTRPGSNPIAVVNSEPKVTSVRIDGPRVSREAPITVTVEGADPDGDPITFAYFWTRNGTALQLPVTTAALSPTYFHRDDVISVSVGATDGFDASAPVASASIIVADAAPSQPELWVTPQHPVAGVDPIVCTIATPAVDLDGDPISYVFTWIRNAQQLTPHADAALSSTVDGSLTNTRDVIECQVQASDGFTMGQPVRSGVTVVAPP